jgi:NADPH:quinone reductase-like Zn-dependent oxidoreductase
VYSRNSKHCAHAVAARARVALLALVALLSLHAADVSAQTIRRYEFSPSGSGFELALREVPMPVAGPREVLVRVHATSLNRRDVLMLKGQYGLSGDVAGTIPLSDGAGEVIAVGAEVERFRVGDRVAGIFFEHWLDGRRTADGLASARGGSAGGMLAEVVVSDEQSLVAIPAHLSYEEAATLPCAGVTAWVGLFKDRPLQPQDFVLLEGTGGVSMFGLLFAAAAGARPIITSSSNDKLEIARSFGAFGTANYRENSEWQDTVRELTGGTGVHQVLEVGGQDTLPRALQTLALDGHIALIGGLSGFGAAVPAGALMGLGASMSGIYVGSREDFENMNGFIAQHEIRPYIDRVFEFEDADEAFDFMENGSYFGKIVIRVQ